MHHESTNDGQKSALRLHLNVSTSQPGAVRSPRRLLYLKILYTHGFYRFSHRYGYRYEIANPPKTHTHLGLVTFKRSLKLQFSKYSCSAPPLPHHWTPGCSGPSTYGPLSSSPCVCNWGIGEKRWRLEKGRYEGKLETEGWGKNRCVATNLT